METIAYLFWVLREHREGCRSARSTAVSTKPVDCGCSLKKSVQIHASSWGGRRCGVAQASFDHLRWCRPHPVCLWFALALGADLILHKVLFSPCFLQAFSSYIYTYLYIYTWIHMYILTYIYLGAHARVHVHFLQGVWYAFRQVFWAPCMRRCLR